MAGGYEGEGTRLFDFVALVAGAGKKYVVDFLVEQWAQGMMEMDNCLNTSLHLAAKAGKTDVVEFCGAVSRGSEGKKSMG
jgi:hypothetical protein